jgi:hypothetical protein
MYWMRYRTERHSNDVAQPAGPRRPTTLAGTRPRRDSDVTDDIAWPRGFDPRSAPVFASNSLHSPLPAEHLWPTLLEASAWPEWYAHASDVRVDGGAPLLEAGSTFRWTTLRVPVVTTVTEFEPSRVLAWQGRGRAARGYHRWVFTPTPDGGCRVLTEEVQVGVVPRLLAARLTRDLRRFHQDWLESLVARSGGTA